MTATAFRAMALSIGDDRPQRPPSPRFPLGIVRNVAVCVALQLAVTIAFPGQSWSMSMGMIGLCLIGAITTRQLGRRSVHPDRFATNAVAGIFVLWALMWASLIYEVNWRDSEQSLSCLLSFMRQIVVILFLVPRSKRAGERWPVVLDAVLGIVLCGVLTTTIWPRALAGQVISPQVFQFCLGHGIYAVLAVSSYLVQRRSPPMFLKAFAITQCVYSLTSIMSVELWTLFGWARNSPLWIYGDTALIAYPLIASYTTQQQQLGDSVPPEAAGSTSNQVVPFLIAMLVLCLAFGSAERQQMMAAIVGVAGLLVYSFRVAFVTRQYRRAQEALVAAGRLRVESLIDVVHELRSPLASVVLNASALARAEDIPPRLRPRVDTIANRCDTVTRLLNDVLDIERIEAGLMDISVAQVDVSAVCRDAVAAVATTADAAGVTLRGPGEQAQFLSAEGDTGLLIRVVVNLLDNAVRFTPAGGLVTVSVGYAGTAEIAVVVEDTGVGLSADAQATLFKRFGHAGKPVNGTKGSGLGLSISASAIAAMDGRLDLTARDDGPGTRATILLKRRLRL